MDDRKLRILAAVVDAYVTTGEPVGLYNMEVYMIP